MTSVPDSSKGTGAPRSGLMCGLAMLLWVHLASWSSAAGKESAAAAVDAGAVVAAYADHVYATYGESHRTAVALEAAVEAFLKAPTAEGLQSCRLAWLVARVPYGQSEVFRFSGGPIDGPGGPEGLINGWPVDESYIDAVEGSPGSGIINRPDLYPELTRELLAGLNEKEGEENISTGYHAIEFLLWGQDFNPHGPGNRPHTDYTTAPGAARRGTYLRLACGLLVDHLAGLVSAWEPGRDDNYRARFEGEPAAIALRKILTGMGMLSGFELSEERIFVATASGEQEDEHSCFSDNTHDDLHQNALGVVIVYYGRGGKPGIEPLVAAADPGLAAELGAQIRESLRLAQGCPRPFDRAVQSPPGSPQRAHLAALVASLRRQAATTARAAETLGFTINIEG